jgi:hypothetical protein
MTALAAVSDVEAVVSRDVGFEDEARILRLIELVSAAVCRYTRQTFKYVADDVITIRPHDGRVRLPQRPIIAVTSVQVSGQIIDPSLYTCNADGFLRRVEILGWNPMLGTGLMGWQTDPYNPTGAPLDEIGWPPIPLTVTYTHGIPVGEYIDDLALVVGEVVAAKWLGGERQANGVISEAIDTYKVMFYKNEPIGAWLPEHQEILRTYRPSQGFGSLRLRK